jgi:hypothetical protein
VLVIPFKKDTRIFLDISLELLSAVVNQVIVQTHGNLKHTKLMECRKVRKDVEPQATIARRHEEQYMHTERCGLKIEDC